ncbi:MAG: hypothetical protein AAB319_05395, partial [Pseudomonadota bacterium]
LPHLTGIHRLRILRVARLNAIAFPLQPADVSKLILIGEISETTVETSAHPGTFTLCCIARARTSSVPARRRKVPDNDG